MCKFGKGGGRLGLLGGRQAGLRGYNFERKFGDGKKVQKGEGGPGTPISPSDTVMERTSQKDRYVQGEEVGR